MIKKFLLLSAVTSMIGCNGSDVTGDADAGGTLIISSPAEADILLPPLVRSTAGRQVADLVFDRLAEIGDDLSSVGDKGYTPRLADGWEWAGDSLSIAFRLNATARWHDGQPVSAVDVAFTYSLYADPSINVAASAVANIDSVTVKDSLTAVFWFARRSPEQFFEATYHMHIVPEHIHSATPRANIESSLSARNPVGTGRFRFVRWDAGATIELVADTGNYRGRPKLDRVIYTIAPDFTTAVTRVVAGEADFFEAMRSEGIEEIRRNQDMLVVPYNSLDYAYIGFNTLARRDRNSPHPLLADRELRRALTMALDRSRMVESAMDSLGVVALGPFVRAMYTADTTLRQIDYSMQQATALLDSLGWRLRSGSEIREKGGRPLSFSMIVPASSRARARIAVLVQEQLRLAGVKLDLEQLEFNAFLARQNARNFDALFGAWHLDPTPAGIRQTWHTPGTAGAGDSNHGAYSNPAFDAAVDSAIAEFDMNRKKHYFSSAYQIIIDDAAAIWMYEPKSMAAAHSRLRLSTLRADAWWAKIDEWSVDPEKRIPRDMIGLRAERE